MEKLTDLLDNIKTKEEINKILYNIIETSFDGIYITDGEANTILVNKSYEYITGLQREKLIGKNMKELVEKEIISISGTLLVLESKKPITLEQKFITNKIALITSQPTFDSDGNIIMVVTNVRDMTRVFSLQNKLKENEINNLKMQRILNKFLEEKTLSRNFVYVDEKSLSILNLANKIAKTDFIVSIFGETGVGKELMAEYIHKNSNRKSQIFLKINCGEFTSDLIESELFGYEKGTFTGGNKNGKIGLFEMANGGTIFLDEIAELEQGMQVKLLRVLQEQEIRRLGGTNSIKINVRVIVATNKNLELLVEQGKFRKDLYYRIEAFQITIPPLRERKNDILPLAELFLKELNNKYNTEKFFSLTAKNSLINYDFPGNVRELKNIIERAYVISNNNSIELDCLFHKNKITLNEITQINLKEEIEKIEAEYIKTAFEKYKNIRRAAKSLDMDHATFLRKKKKYNL